MEWLIRFATRFLNAFSRTLRRIIHSFIENIEAVILLSASTVGITWTLGELPYMYAMPMAYEAAIAIPGALPVMATLLVLMLVGSIRFRIN